MRRSRLLSAVTGLSVMLAACGGDGNDAPPPAPPIGGPAPAPTPAPTPPPTGACSLLTRQQATEAQLREWYLFPETLPAPGALNPANFNSVQAYIDALTATARAQRRDRFFTFLTSIAEENAFINSGASAGFGVRLGFDSAARRLFVTEAFEGAPGLAAGLDRGTEILAIGTSIEALQTIDQIITARGDSGITDALGASTPGLSRSFRVRDANGERNVTVSKADFAIAPVSPRYGARVLQDGNKRVGYVNLRTFIDPADPALRSAFADFRTQGVTEVIVDLRYNGGGLVRIAELLGDLLGGNRSTSEVQSFTVFRPEKASNNSTRNFRSQPQAIGSTKIAFIGTGATASASEEVMNAFIPYLGANAALIGSNTFGKPVGQIALDRAACDDRLRVVAFAIQNAERGGDYYDGIASKMRATCRAGDDISRPLGDPGEASVRAALDFLAGRSCTPIAAGTQGTLAVRERSAPLVTPQPTVAQRETPGLF